MGHDLSVQPSHVGECGRVDLLEARAGVADLVHAYARALDARDFVALGQMFTEDAQFAHPGGVASGREAVVEMFSTRMGKYGLTYHYGHGLGFEEVQPSRTRSVLDAHAELVIGQELYVVALRYHDECVRGADGGWRFASRRQQFIYVLPHSELGVLAASPDPVRWPV